MLRVVAEGVETQEELVFLQAHQCDEAQGYYFSPPVLPQQFASLLRTGIPEARRRSPVSIFLVTGPAEMFAGGIVISLNSHCLTQWQDPWVDVGVADPRLAAKRKQTAPTSPDKPACNARFSACEGSCCYAVQS